VPDGVWHRTAPQDDVSARISHPGPRIGALWGVRVLHDDRFAAVVFGLLAVLSLVRNLPAPEWVSVELRNYAWAFQRLMTNQRIYSVPLPDNPLNPGAHYTPPPFTPLLGGQFASEPIAWGLINLSAMAAGVLFAAAASGVVDRRRVLPAIAISVVGTAAFGPAVTVLLLGNQQGFVVLALGLGWWLERRRRVGTSGVAIAAGALLKLFPGLLFARSIARRQWRVVIAGLATATVVVSSSAVFFGAQRYINFARNLIERAEPAYTRDFNVAPATMLDSLELSALVVVVGMLVIVWSARRDEPAVSFARAIVVSLVAWPVAWYQYASVLLVAVAATADRRTWRWLALSLFLFATGHPVTWIAGAVVGWIGAGRFGNRPEAAREAPLEQPINGLVPEPV
jgi:hypothetical protein